MKKELRKLFAPVDPCCVFQDEENQSYAEFDEMGNREPNEEGTGRFKITQERSKILVINFGSKDLNASDSRLLQSFLSAFFMLEVEYRSHLNSLDLANKTFVLPNGDIFDMATVKPKKLGKKRTPSISISVDVFELFDVLVHLSAAPFYSIVGLFDCHLTEDGSPVLGRACGDGVCCVSLFHCDHVRSLLATTCHELLHTMGVDHATEDRCVMNAISLFHEEWLFLCWENVQKLQLMHRELSQSLSSSSSSSSKRLRDCEKKRNEKENNEDGHVDVEFFKKYHTGLLRALQQQQEKQERATHDKKNTTKADERDDDAETSFHAFHEDCMWLEAVIKNL